MYCTKINPTFTWVFSKFTHIFVPIEPLTFSEMQNSRFYLSRELSAFWLNKVYSLSGKGSICFGKFIKLNCLAYFDFLIFLIGGYNNCFSQSLIKISFFDLFRFLPYPHLSYFFLNH